MSTQLVRRSSVQALFGEESPESLLQLSIRSVVRHGLDTRRLCLPQEVCGLIVETYRQHFHLCRVFKLSVADFVRQFQVENSRISEANFSGLPITDETFDVFIRDHFHNLTSLDISDCTLLTCDALKTINEMAEKCPKPLLQSLVIAGRNEMMSEHYNLRQVWQTNKLLIHPKLPITKLVIHDFFNAKLRLILTHQMATKLKHLELKYFYCTARDTAIFGQLQVLEALVLCDCYSIESVIDDICKIKTLRHLDISQSEEEEIFDNPNQVLSQLVTSLPELTWLDISNTNLAGPPGNYIVGLESRTKRPLEFLGLYSADNETANRRKIPALKIAGNATEQQILTACEVYINRTPLLEQAISDLFQLFHINSNHQLADVRHTITVLMSAVEHHLKERRILTNALAVMTHILKSEQMKTVYTVKSKRQIVRRILDVMWSHTYDKWISIYGTQCLLTFDLLRDLNFKYHYLIVIGLRLLQNEDDTVRASALVLFVNMCSWSHIRRRMMTDRSILRLLDLLKSSSTEVSCLAANVLAYIASDGSQVWYRHLTINLDKVLFELYVAVSHRWPINNKMNFSYESLEPFRCILRMKGHAHLTYWVVWMLANLTRCHATKYCPLLAEADGIELVERLATYEWRPHIIYLAQVVLYHYYLFLKDGDVNEDTEDIDVPEEFANLFRTQVTH